MPTVAVRKKDFVFHIQGLDCPHCASELETAIRALSGVEEAVLRFPSGVLRVRGAIDETIVVRLIRQSGYHVADSKNARPVQQVWWKTSRAFSSFLSVAFLCCALLVDWLALFDTRGLYLAALVSGGWMTATSAFWSLRRKQIDMNTLMLIAVFGALWLGDWGEAASVVVLFAFGNTLQAYSLAKTNRSLEALFSAAPDMAWRLENGSPHQVLPEELSIGDFALVQAGERIPADGVIQSGRASLNEAAITGESLPVEKGPGSFVYAGSWATDASLTIEVTQEAAGSTLARIRQLVLNAQEGKTRSQLLIERFAKLYTPAVVGAATLLTAIPWMLGEDPSVWFYRSLVLLVISCPCALVLATPVAMTAALGQASGRGMLIKSGEYLEAVGKTKAIAFDKTGTLSFGELSLSECFPASGVSKSELLQIAADLEAGSTHPIAAALRASGVQPSDRLPTVNVVPGLGLTSEENGTIAAIGNATLLQRYGLSPNQLSMPIDERSLTVYVIKNHQLLGALQFQDIVRPESSAVLKQLRALGVENLSMLTGDQAGSANAFAQNLSLDTVNSALLPEDKAELIKELKTAHGTVMMVGDGINDAPALALADIGVAMGAAGSDVAIETADVALTNSQLNVLPDLIQLGRKTLSVIRQNILFALVVKAAFLLLAGFGMTNLWMAIFADTGTALLVTINGLRLMWAETV